LTLEKIEPHRSIAFKLAFIAPYESEASDSWTFEPTANGTKATWHNTGALAYPIMRYMGLMFEGMLGPQFEQGLQGLKELCEAQADPMSMNSAASDSL